MKKKDVCLLNPHRGCFVCGEPVVQSTGFCEKHLERWAIKVEGGVKLTLPEIIFQIREEERK